jgi:Secretion system C-terminal sorting domain
MEFPMLVIGAGTNYPTASSLPSAILTGKVLVIGNFTVDVPLIITNALVQVDNQSCIDVVYYAGVFDPNQGLAISKSRIYSCRNMWRGIRVHQYSNLSIQKASSIEDAEIAVHCTALAGIYLEGTTFDRDRVGVQLENGSVGGDPFQFYWGPYMPTFEGNRFICTQPLKTPMRNEVTEVGVRLRDAWLYPTVSNDLNIYDHIQRGIEAFGKRSRINVVGSSFLNNFHDGIYMEFGFAQIAGSYFYNNRVNGVNIGTLQRLESTNNSYTWDLNLPIITAMKTGILVQRVANAGYFYVRDDVYDAQLAINQGNLTCIWNQGFSTGDGITTQIRESQFNLSGGGNLFGCIDYGKYRHPNTHFVNANQVNISTPGIATGMIFSQNKTNLHVEGNDFSTGDEFGFDRFRTAIVFSGSEGLGNHFTDNRFLDGPYLSGYGHSFRIAGAKNTLFCNNICSNSRVTFGFSGNCMGTNMRLNESYGPALVEIYQSSFIDQQTRKSNKWDHQGALTAATPQATCLANPFLSTFLVHRPQSTSLGSEAYHPLTINPDVKDEFWRYEQGGFIADCYFGQVTESEPSALKLAIALGTLANKIQNPHVARDAESDLYALLKTIPVPAEGVYAAFQTNKSGSNVGKVHAIESAVSQKSLVDSSELKKLVELNTEIASFIALQSASLDKVTFQSHWQLLSKKYADAALVQKNLASSKKATLEAALNSLNALNAESDADGIEISILRAQFENELGLELSDRSEIVRIARLCPEDYGIVVNQARALFTDCAYCMDGTVPQCKTYAPIAQAVNSIERSVQGLDDLLVLSPNPATDFVHMPSDFAHSDGQIQFYNQLGQLIQTASLDQTTSPIINVAHLPVGTYTVVLKSAYSESVSKLVIER